MTKPLDLAGYKPSPELLIALIKSDELAIMNLTGITDEWATQAIRTLEAEVARLRAALANAT